MTIQLSPSLALMDLSVRHALLNTVPVRELLLGSGYVFQQLRALHQTFVLLYVEEHSRALAMLRQDERAASTAHLLDERGRVGTEFRERANVLAKWIGRIGDSM